MPPSSISMPVELRAAGLYLPSLALYLDPHEPVPRAFVSHAHGDHVGAVGAISRGGSVVGSRETLSLVAARGGSTTDAAALDWDASLELAVERAYGSGTARLSIAPAGHILGAAQLVVDHPGGRFVYTGDYRTGGDPTHAAGAAVQCDELLIESTFGLPIFRFPPREEVKADVVAWCRATLADGYSAVLLAYALGKSQTLVAALLDAGLPVVAHGAVYRMCAAYEALGVPLGVGDGRLVPYAEEKKRKRTPVVMVVPPGTAGQPMIQKRNDVRVAYVSGWALLDASLEQRRANAGFPLSDHADYDDLAATVIATGARRVHVTHGQAPTFAHILNTLDLHLHATALDAKSMDTAEEAP